MITKEMHVNNKCITFYIGNNAKENFDILDMSNPDDIWFHSKDFSSCHVIAKIGERTGERTGERINKKDIHHIVKIGCILCKENTNKIKNIKNTEIIYTRVKNVKKSDIIGSVYAVKTNIRRV
jgi:predicted ribosome quality control (RQC) complex YloA/Tae2 family protein